MTLGPLLLALVVAAVLGVLVVEVLWPVPGPGARPWPLMLSLGAALGVALTSALYMRWALSLRFLGVPFLAVEGSILLVGVVARPGTWRRGGLTLRRAKDLPLRRLLLRRPVSLLLVAMLIAGTGFATAAVGRLLSNEPHGQWDAWMMWNLKARYLYLGGEHWPALLSFEGVAQRDYPLLQPTAIARLWSYVGTDTPVGPHAFALATLLLTVALMMAGVGWLRGLASGVAAGLVLLSLPAFLRHAASLYADNTLAL